MCIRDSGKGVADISNILGYNFRMGEIEAAIGIEQLKKLRKLVDNRIEIAELLSKNFKNLEGLTVPKVLEGYSHSFYVYGLKYDEKKTSVSRDKIFQALKAEGAPVVDCYANLHLYPMYQQKIAYGKNGFPWNSSIYKGDVSYDKGICPVAEELNDKTFLKIPLCDYEFNSQDVQLLIDAFRKVWNNLEKLK